MTAQDASQWYIARDGKQTGPITDAEINAIAAHGYFRASDLVWRPGFAEWCPALTIFKPAAEAPPPTPPAPVASEPAPAPAASQPVASPAAAPAQPAVFERPAEAQPRGSEFRAETPAPAVMAPREQTARPSWQPEPAREPAAPAASAASYQPKTQPHGLAPLPGPRAPSPDAARLPASPPYRTEPSQRPLNPSPASYTPAAAPRETTAPAREAAQPSRRALTPVDDGPEPDSLPERPRRHRGAIAALVITLGVVAAGVWIVAYPQFMQNLPALKSIAKSVVIADPAARQVADLDARWQRTVHWPIIKREFPDWYGDRLREAAKLANENKPDEEINKALVDEMIALRRQNASQALSASTPKLRALANAFLDNLRQLKAQSTTACFNFISQGEGTPGVIDQFQAAGSTASPMQVQVAAIFDAIGDGRRTPVTHDKPVKADYDALMEQLSKLGWTQADVATFADPKALARAEPARVCQMVQDWFVAHISIADEPTQERLLGETLRPVVSG